ncbi:MAG: hypothetical protein QW633_02480 [Candidatus Aenigmatarchaeota archaeon]
MKRKIVIKIGGSLEKKFYDETFSEKFCKVIKSLDNRYRILVVPGGGSFADFIRDIDKKIILSSRVSDRMAIISMDLYGLFLSHIFKIKTTYSLTKALKRRLVIFLPSHFIFKTNPPLKRSWDVTSDSISAFLAKKINAERLILVKDVDGIYTRDPKIYKEAKLLNIVRAKELIGKETCIDNYLPKFLLKNPLYVSIVNGKYPERIKEALKGKLKIGTIIIAR